MAHLRHSFYENLINTTAIKMSYQDGLAIQRGRQALGLQAGPVENMIK